MIVLEEANAVIIPQPAKGMISSESHSCRESEKQMIANPNTPTAMAIKRPRPSTDFRLAR